MARFLNTTFVCGTLLCASLKKVCSCCSGALWWNEVANLGLAVEAGTLSLNILLIRNVGFIK